LKFDVKIYDSTQCQKEYEAEVHFQQILLLCNLLFWLSFCVFCVISTCDEFYFVPPLLIDHGNESSFRGILLTYYRVPFEPCLLLSNIGLQTTLKYLSNNRGYRISIICVFYFIRLEGQSPRVEK
jgi:hypothetical protein